VGIGGGLRRQRADWWERRVVTEQVRWKQGSAVGAGADYVVAAEFSNRRYLRVFCRRRTASIRMSNREPARHVPSSQSWMEKLRLANRYLTLATGMALVIAGINGAAESDALRYLGLSDGTLLWAGFGLMLLSLMSVPLLRATLDAATISEQEGRVKAAEQQVTTDQPFPEFLKDQLRLAAERCRLLMLRAEARADPGATEGGHEQIAMALQRLENHLNNHFRTLIWSKPFSQTAELK
jgi:hypothetical protein